MKTVSIYKIYSLFFFDFYIFLLDFFGLAFLSAFSNTFLICPDCRYLLRINISLSGFRVFIKMVYFLLTSNVMKERTYADSFVDKLLILF